MKKKMNRSTVLQIILASLLFSNNVFGLDDLEYPSNTNFIIAIEVHGFTNNLGLKFKSRNTNCINNLLNSFIDFRPYLYDNGSVELKNRNPFFCEVHNTKNTSVVINSSFVSSNNELQPLTPASYVENDLECPSNNNFINTSEVHGFANNLDLKFKSRNTNGIKNLPNSFIDFRPYLYDNGSIELKNRKPFFCEVHNTKNTSVVINSSFVSSSNELQPLALLPYENNLTGQSNPIMKVLYGAFGGGLIGLIFVKDGDLGPAYTGMAIGGLLGLLF